MWSAEKLSAISWLLPVRFCVATSKLMVTGPWDTSYDSGLETNPVGVAADTIPRKLGFPPAAAEVAKATSAMLVAPTTAASPPMPRKRVDFLLLLTLLMALALPLLRCAGC